MKTNTIIILLITFYSVTILSQNSTINITSPTSLNVKAIDDFLVPVNGLQNNANQSAVALLNIQNVKNLIYNTQPSIYYFSGVEKIYGEKPKNLFTDLNSLSNLNNVISLKNNIEIIIIKLENTNQLNSTISLELFSSFKNLKYIYIISSFDTTAQAIANMIVGSNDQYSVFFNVEKGDTN
ncbi:hypothetical protein [Flavobacterium macrobrachii]|uniref:DUF4252 domain-containing protein n=1 Tax=Flavobacterium macrobrachii TaxID=591204 RepID=A0ABS2CXI2_9FLAO|nr:hypothetical protein [Flavobacterium macrobrachii]MBM6499616.1 hypothetical protein [Flavobacterium macrobrachii]